MSHTTIQLHAEETTPADQGYLHIVFEGRIRALITRLLRRAPRTLCGASLWGDPDEGLSPYSPHCPACVEVSGLTTGEIAERVEYVAGYWV